MYKRQEKGSVVATLGMAVSIIINVSVLTIGAIQMCIRDRPYTSERAKQKVVDLAKIVAKYAGPINLHVVNFTDIQLAIYEKCPHEELTIIMRRYMMKIAEHFANEGGSLALITGESIGQVASQTDVYKGQLLN